MCRGWSLRQEFHVLLSVQSLRDLILRYSTVHKNFLLGHLGRKKQGRYHSRGDPKNESRLVPELRRGAACTRIRKQPSSASAEAMAPVIANEKYSWKAPQRLSDADSHSSKLLIFRKCERTVPGHRSISLPCLFYFWVLPERRRWSLPIPRLSLSVQ